VLLDTATDTIREGAPVCSAVFEEVFVVLFRVSRRASMLVAATLLALTLLVITPAARAGLLDLSGLACGNEQFTHPFAPWGDQSSYALVPGGAFEPGDAAWNTTGVAGVLAGNEPWHVHGSGDGSSLSLAPGASATSQPTCVTLSSPTLRFFARGSGGSPGSSLSVEVLFRSTAGLLDSLPIGSVSASGDWSPTPTYLILANALSVADILPLLGGNYHAVAFRFTPRGDATWQIDDVYVDPYQKG
jgi:hypothetical protein